MTATPVIRERPLILTAAEVRATREGRKRQFRRPVKPQPQWSDHAGDPESDWYLEWCDPRTGCLAWEWQPGEPMPPEMLASCPFGRPGDRLYVKETWQTHEDPTTMIDGILYRADGAFLPIENTREAAERWIDAAHLRARPEDMAEVRPGLLVGTARKAKGWRSPAVMPRWASRLTLEVVEVRVQRLQDITEVDARSEGVERLRTEFAEGTYRYAFATIWEATHGRKPGCSWALSPWVWAVTYRPVESR